MSSTVVARRADRESLSSVQNLFTTLIDELEAGTNYPDWHRNVYPTEAYFEEKLDAGELVLFEDEKGVLIGAVVVNETYPKGYETIPWQIPFDEPSLIIHTYGIENKKRGQGLGLASLNALVAYAKELGYRALRCDTYDTNMPAIRLYERGGFTNLGVFLLNYEVTDHEEFNLFEKIL